MIKVGILSMQRICNYGSFLQAYALKKVIEEFGCNVVFVDFHPGKVMDSCHKGRRSIRKISKGIEALKYHVPWKEKIRYIQYKKNFPKKYYPYLGIDNTRNYTPPLDLLVIGSDEVFNCVQDNVNVGFSPELFGEGNRAGRVISYAASFGNTTLEKMEQYKIKEQVGEWLKGFDAVSVRDFNSIEIVHRLTGKKPEYHFDPVLLYDFSSQCQRIPELALKFDYMILYGYSGRFTQKECEEIKKFADSKRLKLFCMGGVQSYCDRFIDCSPFELIAYFNHAAYVVTDTFHGTILSVITHQRFVVLLRENGNGNKEKLTDILKRLKLESCRIDDLQEFEEKLEKEISYNEIDNIIQKERQRTYEYLRSWINDGICCNGNQGEKKNSHTLSE